MNQDRPATGRLTPERLNTALLKTQESLALLAEIFQAIAPALVEAWVQKLPDIYRAELMTLANEGWFPDPVGLTSNEQARIARAYSDGRHQEAEVQLLGHFRGRLQGIEDALVQQFPARTAILRQAFEAHRQELYFASVPTLFTQIDGVCLDISTHYLFMKGRGETRTGVAPYVDQIADSALSQAMLAPFLEPHAVLLSERQRAPGFSKLNRHMVLHGESFDYGTEANSLRAVSLLFYAARALSEFGTTPTAAPNTS